MSSVQVHARGTGAAYAYDTLRREILGLELEPGQELDEAGLVARLGLSRTPVREALIRLAADELVVLLPNRGAKVAPLDLADTPRYIEALDLAQRAVHRFAALRRTEADLSRIDEARDAFEASIPRRDAMEMTERNRNFHAKVAEASQNRYLAGHYVRLLDQGMRLLRIPFAYDPAGDGAETHIAKIVEDHRRITAAIAARDADLADALGHAHAELFQSRLMMFLQQNLSPGVAIA
jgi:DNA-binding GntR family transcriptional regulator